jgi:hypothetical protein
MHLFHERSHRYGFQDMEKALPKSNESPGVSKERPFTSADACENRLRLKFGIQDVGQVSNLPEEMAGCKPAPPSEAIIAMLTRNCMPSYCGLE